MFSRILITTAAVCTMAHAGVRSGKATADLLAASSTYQPGQPVQVAVRLKVDVTWHTYWSNPGEGGMKLGVKWNLPPGWTASEPSYPVPKAFLTGGLAGYGYSGTVIYPITLTPPKDATGEVKPTAAISWLTCNDDACVPGKAEISVSLTPGAPAATPAAEEIQASLAKIPLPVAGLALKAVEQEKNLALTLQAPADLDLSTAEVFPETPQAVDPATPIQFQKSGDAWTATVPKNEYATGPLKTLTLVIGLPSAPARVTWNAENP